MIAFRSVLWLHSVCASSLLILKVYYYSYKIEETITLIIIYIPTIKQTELTEKITIVKSSISQYLSGKVIPKLDKIYLMVKTLGINEAWLMGHDIEMPRAASNYSQTSPSIIQPKKELLTKYKALDQKDNI
ncbi:helix-turn-helix domain-containing protein [Zhenhengia yiwuensis]|uniref:helix-turn-helix domain-containing protein n=1 Tax=Zhenhengia yiwuensis TaxID=2763666 RepID=UPI002ED578E9